MKLHGCALTGLVAAALSSYAGDAAACGGCFAPPAESTVVTGHRMALSVSTSQTVLWDQIQYSGNPTDFAWVLPIKPGAVIELSTDAWFEALEQGTLANVIAPPINCPNQGGGFGCGSLALAENFSGTGGGSDPHVTVLHEGTVGPYDTVTLMADQQGVLNDWLSSHGYNVDASTQPIIDAYVAEGFNFIALRLQPTKDVQQMKPVRVRTQGASAALPLRMVAAGTGPEVAITLFVISEGRYAADGFANTTVDNHFLAWDFVSNTSNFAELRSALLEQNGGATWLTAYAGERPFFTSPKDPLSGGFYGFSEDFTALNTLADVYFDKGLQNGELDALCQGVAAQFTSVASSVDRVTNPCPPGAPLDDPSCGTVAVGETDARLFVCGALDDFAAALDGLHPRDVWLTRLEANLPRALLGSDLTVSPAGEQAEVSNWHQATIAANTEGFCPSAGPPIAGLDKKGGSGGDRGMWFGAGAMGLALVGALRRLLRRRAARSEMAKGIIA